MNYVVTGCRLVHIKQFNSTQDNTFFKKEVPSTSVAPDLNGDLEGLDSLVVVPVVHEAHVELLYLPQVLHLTQVECLPHAPVLQVVQLLQAVLYLLT